jgi:two-component sensor histidine kinase
MQTKNFGGMTIIQVLTEQLNGTFEYKRVKTGTEFSLSFDKNEAHGSASSLLL